MIVENLNISEPMPNQHPLTTIRFILRASVLTFAVDVLIFVILLGFRVPLIWALTLSFLAAYAIGYAAGFKHVFDISQRTAAGGVGSRLARYVPLCLLGFGLRGGIFADFTQFLSWPAMLAIVPGAFASAVVVYAGHRFFALLYAGQLTTSAALWRLVATGAVAYMLALRLAFLGLINLLPEEAYYWNFSQHPDIGYLDHPPMSAWMIWLGTHIFGNTEFGVRIGAYAAWIAVAFLVHRLTINLFDRTTAMVGVVLTAVLPVFFYTGFMMTPDVPLIIAWAGALYFLERALVGQRRNAWWGVGISAGLGMVSKYTIALLGPSALIFLIIDPSARRWLKRPEPYIAAILALLLFSPVIYWNATHGWASFAFQSTHRLDAARTFSTPALIGSAALLLTPLGLVSAIAIFASKHLRIKLAPKDDIEARRKLLFMFIFTATPLSVFLAFSLTHQVKFDWTGPIWLAILPAIAAIIVKVAPDSSRFEAMMRSLWAPTLVGTLAIYAVFLHYLVLGLPFAGNFGNIRTLPVAWDEFGRQVGVIQQTVEKETGQTMLLAGMDKYYAASEIAFYDRQGDAVSKSVSSGPFNNESLMYGYWFKPSEMQGRTMILIGVKKSDVEQEDLGRYFGQLTDIRTQDVRKNGVSFGQFFYRIGYGYRDCSLPQNSCPPQ